MLSKYFSSILIKDSIYFTNSVTIRGEVNFEQNSPSENLNITVTNVSGLEEGNHGFHIHGNGTCKDPGSHFNPSKVRLIQ